MFLPSIKKIALKFVTSRVLIRNTTGPPRRPYIIRKNVLSKFHEYCTILVTSRVLTRKLSRLMLAAMLKTEPTNVLTKFQKDWTINVTSRVFKLGKDITRTNLLNKFEEDQTTSVVSRVLTRQMLTKGGHKSSQ
ncbi:hypothetical protein DPMN_054245 [Dreissena polymorpha]|uniref:Uncharacterized protein n=1 Tax=Dreissena polymorpha TaxID=45954 RepID=A0A9D4HRF0_DREPO|nr:hypothetical protein DPMN_054245 [Dreissena polymorpha]